MSFEPSRPRIAAPPERRSLLLTFLQPKVAVPLAVLVALVVAPFAYRGAQVAGLPDAGEPFDLEAAGRVAIAPGDNAFDDYSKAESLLVPLKIEVDFPRAMNAEWSDLSDDVRSWGAANRPAFEQWRAGTAKPDGVSVQPEEMRITTVLSIQNMRTFGWLARLEASRQQDAGALDEAWSALRALFRGSRHCGRYGCIIERYVGMALHSMAAEGMERWSRDPRVTAAQLERALREVQEDDRLTAPPSSTLKAEYFVMFHEFDEAQLAMYQDRDSSAADRALRKLQCFLAHEPLNSRLVMRQIYANWLEHIDKPLSELPPTTRLLGLFEGGGAPLPRSRLSAEQIESCFLRAPLALEMVPAIDRFKTASIRERARQATLGVALAAQLHQRRTGEYPAKLEELVDAKILSEIPRDPCSRAGDSIRYARDNERVAAWSVGDDGVDDGGDVSDPARSRQVKDVGVEIVPRTAATLNDVGPDLGSEGESDR